MEDPNGKRPAPQAVDDGLSDFGPVAVPPSHGPLAQVAYALGAVGLLGATGADALAVLGRHTGLHLLGSIELVQSAVVLLGCAAMLIATIIRGHASVHIVTDRLALSTRRRLARAAALAGAVLFAILAAGTGWIVAELWHGREETELLHLPIRWLRLLWLAFTVLIALRFLRHALEQQA